MQCLGICGNQRLRPADLLISGDDFPHTCVDVTVVSPICKTLPSNFVLGKASLDAENQKILKHEASCSLAGYGFHPFAVDVFGIVAPSSLNLLERVATKYAAVTGMTFGHCFSIVKRRVSFAIQLGAARQLANCNPFIVDPDEFSVYFSLA